MSNPIYLSPKIRFLLVFVMLLAILVAFSQAGEVTAAPVSQPPVRPARQGEAEWTIMLYQDADDEVLEQDIMIDFNEAERVGSTDQVNIVSQVDRFEGAFDGMGDWTGTKRFYITQDDDMDNIASEELADLGEVNMADSQTLVDFIAWSVQNFPARKYALIMSDHGAGWPGGFGDPAPGGPGPDDVVLQQMFGVDQMWLMELDKALEEARAQTGLEQFEFIGFDACLMSQLEVFNAVAPHGRYSVASQETEPSLGWAYTSFLDQLVNNPQMDGAALSQLIVETYIDQDQRILDDATRQQFLSDMGADSGISPEILAADLGQDITLTAVDLSAIPAVNAAVDNLAVTLVSVDPQAVAEARAYAQSFESVFGEETPSPYIDLGHFAQLVTELTGNAQVSAAAEELINSLSQAILAEKHGPNRPGATGLTIYFPTGELFNAADNLGYATVAGRFAEVSRWDEFLAAFHGGGGAAFTRPQEAPPETAAPEQPAGLTEEDVALIQKDVAYLQELGYTPEEIPQILVDQGGYSPDLVQTLADAGFFETQPVSQAAAPPPAAAPKPIQLAPLTLSAELVSPDQPVNIQSEVSGDRLAYLYTFIGRFLPRQNVLLIEDKDYLFADQSKEVNGVKYPDWGEGSLTVNFDWEPTVYAVGDGQNSVKALIEPEAYDAELPVYSVGATYHPASGGDPRFAKIYFREGTMTEIFGFTGSITQALGAPRQILPQPGDEFALLERGDDLSQEGEAGRESYVHESGTLTFNGEPFTIETTPAPSGNYVVGLIAEDLDGNTYEQYEGLFVVNEQASAVDGFAPFASEELGFALLYPETWTAEEDVQAGMATFTGESGSAMAVIFRQSYPDAAGAAAANSQAIQDTIDMLQQDNTLENLQFVTEVGDYVLGSFDAQVIDFSFDQAGKPAYGYAVAATPVPGTTYIAIVGAEESQFDARSKDFDDMLYSFDILISGVSKEQAGPPVPELVDETFGDDFSDPTSGLIDGEEEQEWGRGYYADSGQYTIELKPNPGAIYDYYADRSLPDEFLLEATGSYNGAVNNAYGLIFQVQVGQESDDFYTFRISGDGFYTVEKTDGGQIVPIIDWTASSLIDQAEGAANVLAVAGTGDAYTLYINGQQVNSFTDATYSGGTFGFMVDNYDEKAPASFTFDDLKVGAAAK